MLRSKMQNSRHVLPRGLAATGTIAFSYALSLAMRWVPSEINVADKPSRSGLRCSKSTACPRKPTLRMARVPAEPHRIIRGIRLSRLAPVVIADPELKVAKRSRIRASLGHLSVFTFPRKRDLELISVGTMTQNAHGQSLLRLASWTLGISDSAFQTAPTLTGEQRIPTILDLGKNEVELDDFVAGFINAALWEGSHSSLGARLASALAWATMGPSEGSSCQTSPSVAAGRRSGNSSRLPLPSLRYQ